VFKIYAQYPEYIYISLVPFGGMASFCAQCGKEIADGTRYCPVCGFDSMSNTGNRGVNNQKTNSQGMGGALLIIVILGILWAIASLIAGVLYLIGGSLLASITGFVGGAIVGSIFVIVGIIFLVTGILTTISCVWIIKLEKHQQACNLCLASSVIVLVAGFLILPLGAIFVGIIGIVFWYLIKKEQSRFKS
jgi:hypothetical protein